jgi:hypothetical protein
MKKITYLTLIVGLILSVGAARSTTVTPPTFDQLVEQAEVIFQGNVTKVQSQWVGEGADRHIMSLVTFDVKDAVKGKPGRTYTISMVGGTVDGETMEVADAPKFNVGDEDILFVENNGTQFIPLVGIMHGRFHVRRDDSGRELVTTNEEEPLDNVARLGRETAAAQSPQAALTSASFKAAIRNRLNASAQAQP